MRMRLMLLGGGNALGQALIRLGAEEDIGFLAPRPPAEGWDAPSLTELLDVNRPDVVINLAYYYDWFQSGQVDEALLSRQERAVERLAELCQHHQFALLQPSSYRVFDGARTTAYSERTRLLRWTLGAGPCGEPSKVFGRYARSTSCCGLAGCSTTVRMACSVVFCIGSRRAKA